MSRPYQSVRSAPLRQRPLAIGLAAAIACASVRANPPPIVRPDGDFVLPVTNCDDAGPGSLRDVLASAFNGDHIIFVGDLGCNLVTLTSGPIVIANDVIGQPFTLLDITGLGRDALTIDGGNIDRVFVQSAGADAFLTLRDLKIAHGQTSGNGGCVFAQGSIALSDVEISDCKAGIVSGDVSLGNTPVRGGGLYAARNAMLENSLVTGNGVYGNAAYAYGGGVFAINAITLTSSSIDANAVHSVGGASYGGGIAAGDRAGHFQATVALMSSLVTNNSGDSQCDFCGVRGGGVWVYGTSSFTGGEISGNGVGSSAGYGTGGGLYFNAHFGGPPVSATVTGTAFHCNVADDSGGAIAAGGDLSIAGATLDCNSATSDGGAIELLGGSLTLMDSTLTGNVAKGRGGAIFLFGYGVVATSNSTISGNTAANGGAIGNTYGSLSLANSTIAFNQASAHGGGVYERYAYYPFDLRSSIVAGNTGGGGPDDLWPPGMTVTGSNDLVVAATGVDLPADTLSADPLLGALAPNGGPTSTHALGEGSPAIDAGNNDAALEFDQRGPGFVRVYGVAADIGAFEVQPMPPTDSIFVDGFDPT